MLYFPDGHGIFSLPPQALDNWGDLNGDGYLDVVATQYDAASARMDWVAFSGIDGSTLWRFHNPYLWGPWGQVGDLDRDGARDIAISELPTAGPTWSPGRLWVISGRDAHVLWEIPIGKLLPWYGVPQPDKAIDFRSITSLGDWDRDGIPDLLIPAREQHNIKGWLPWTRYAAWIFSGLDGTPLAYEYLAPDLSPWYPADSLDRPLYGVVSHLGDVDGDGWTELTAIVYSHDLSTSSIYRYVFYGRRILKAPAEVTLGQAVSYGLDVPAGAGLSFQVLLSTELAWPGEGMVVGDGWELPVRPTALTRLARFNGHLRGVLDARGRAQASFPVPWIAALQGRDVYAVAVVENPSHADGIQTVSTLAISHVRP